MSMEIEYGGLRAAARVLDVSPSYLSRLRDGEKINPSNKILKKLGLKKVILYVKV